MGAAQDALVDSLRAPLAPFGVGTPHFEVAIETHRVASLVFWVVPLEGLRHGYEPPLGSFAFALAFLVLVLSGVLGIGPFAFAITFRLDVVINFFEVVYLRGVIADVVWS